MNSVSRFLYSCATTLPLLKVKLKPTAEGKFGGSGSKVTTNDDGVCKTDTTVGNGKCGMEMLVNTVNSDAKSGLDLNTARTVKVRGTPRGNFALMMLNKKYTSPSNGACTTTREVMKKLSMYSAGAKLAG
jgi:hypothetical protein